MQDPCQPPHYLQAIEELVFGLVAQAQRPDSSVRKQPTVSNSCETSPYRTMTFDPSELPPLLGQAPALSRADGAGLAGGAARPPGPGDRRARHRQGADRGPAALSVAALGSAAGQAQRRRDPRDPARERAVRPRGRRLHRRDPAPRRPLRARPRRQPVPRRDRRDQPRGPGAAAARGRVRQLRSGRRQRSRSRSTSG